MHAAIKKLNKSMMLAISLSETELKQCCPHNNPFQTYWEIDGDLRVGLEIKQVNDRSQGRKLQKSPEKNSAAVVYFRSGPLGGQNHPVRKTPVRGQLSKGYMKTSAFPPEFVMVKKEVEPPRMSEKSVGGMTPSAHRQPVLDDLYTAVELVNELKKRLSENVMLAVDEDGLLNYTVEYKPRPKSVPQVRAVK